MAFAKLITRRRLKRTAIAAAALISAAHLYVIAFGILPSPRTHTMTQRVMVGQTLERQNVKIEDISPYLIAAVIAAEDARFCVHNGIDREAVMDAIEHNKKGGKRRGGSTITQQTAKNLFFWNGGGMARKAGEAYAALLIDTLWSKPRIMEHYLNIAEWGDGIFGAEAAAQSRFGKPASALTSYQAALLASVLPSPNKWRLDPPSQFIAGRARTINARLKVTVREGFGDCVLENHPAYKISDFRTVRPISKPTSESSAEEILIDVTGPSTKNPAEDIIKTDIESTSSSLIVEDTAPATPALKDILARAENVAQAARETETSPPKTIQSQPKAPRDIRPPALKPPKEQSTATTEISDVEKQDTD